MPRPRSAHRVLKKHAVAVPARRAGEGLRAGGASAGRRWSCTCSCQGMQGTLTRRLNLGKILASSLVRLTHQTHSSSLILQHVAEGTVLSCSSAPARAERRLLHAAFPCGVVTRLTYSTPKAAPLPPPARFSWLRGRRPHLPNLRRRQSRRRHPPGTALPAAQQAARSSTCARCDVWE